MKKLLLLIFIGVRLNGFAQSDTAIQRIIFLETEWNFGDIPENVPVRHEFKFTNKGNIPVLIAHAAGSGGGQIPEWNKEPAAPDKNGVVSVLFGAFNPGNFTKAATVYFNTGEEFVLLIRGNVIQKEQDTSRKKISFRFSTTTFNLDTVPGGPDIRCEFVLYNTGETPITIQKVNSSCGCLVFEWPKEPIIPGDSGIIKAVMSTRSRPGPFTKNGTVYLNDNSVSVLTLKGYIKPE